LDITEAFEIHHLRGNAEKLLPKFFIREAKAPRNSLVTFHENGFFKTLKRRLAGQLSESGPTIQVRKGNNNLLSLSKKFKKLIKG